MYLGAHVSISKGYEHAIKEAISIGANTLQFFSRNPRGSAVKALNPNDIKQAQKLCKNFSFGPLIAHAPYTLNLASNKEKTREFARMVLREDLERLETVKATYLVMHPGSHVGEGIKEGIDKIASGLKNIVTGEESVMVLLETMAGAGSEVGYTFEQLYDIMDKTGNPEAFGVCLDTCHVLGAGYDIIGKLDEVLVEFDRILGSHRLKAVHLNDSKYPIASRKDRHASLGEGELGLDSIKNIINHPVLRTKPFLLETPGGLENYKKEIELLKSMIVE